jgi:O-antigen/teichoic acid export membrane protein
MINLRERTVSGLKWNAATQAAAKALQFIALVVLARLLSPNEFGLFGMILVFTGFASIVADAGLNASIIQKQDLSEANLNSAFWLSVVIGLALAIILSCAAPLIAHFYGEPQLRTMTIVLALNFIFSSSHVVQYALIHKALDFQNRFRIETVAISSSGIVALVMALAGAGVWSLVGQSLCENSVRAAMAWRVSAWRPRRMFDRAAAKELLKFGRNLVGFHVVVYFGQNFDKLWIGHQIGSSALGFYNLSERIMRVPLNNISAMTGTVMFPALSHLQDNIELMKRAYLRANRMIALLTFPMFLGISALAEPTILIAYGQQWRGAVHIAQLLCIAGLAQSIYNTGGWILLSRGRPDILFRLGILSMTVRVAGVLIGMHWGLIGIASAYVIGGYVFLMYPTMYLAGSLINLRVGEVLKTIAPPFYCSAIMAVAIWLSDQWFFIDKSVWLRLSFHVLTGTALYGFLIIGMNLEAWQDARILILETVGKRFRLVRFLLDHNRPVDGK